MVGLIVFMYSALMRWGAKSFYFLPTFGFGKALTNNQGDIKIAYIRMLA